MTQTFPVPVTCRSTIAHLWLVTLHPFDDGNVRVTRVLTDRALAQADATSVRYDSHGATIMARRREYYDTLQQSQSSSLDITLWLSRFLHVLLDAMQQGQLRFERVLYKTRFWQHHAQTVLNEHQVKVLNRLLDTWGGEFTSGINASKYQRLDKVSKATATRELADLIHKDCLHKLPGGGRSTRYALCSHSHPTPDTETTRPVPFTCNPILAETRQVSGVIAHEIQRTKKPTKRHRPKQSQSAQGATRRARQSKKAYRKTCNAKDHCRKKVTLNTGGLTGPIVKRPGQQVHTRHAC